MSPTLPGADGPTRETDEHTSTALSEGHRTTPAAYNRAQGKRLGERRPVLLVVDDESVMLDIVERFAHKEGFDVIGRRGGQEVVAALERGDEVMARAVHKFQVESGKFADVPMPIGAEILHADLQQRRRSDPLQELHELSPARRDRADVAADVQGRAALDQVDRFSGLEGGDAAVARRSGVR